MSVWIYNHHKAFTMKVIAVLNQKGGSGKTTIAFSTWATTSGHSVLLVDSDQQGSTAIEPLTKTILYLSSALMTNPDKDPKTSLIKSSLWLMARHKRPTALSAIKAADFVLIPVQQALTTWATSDLVELVQQRIEMTDGKLKAAFVSALSKIPTSVKKSQCYKIIICRYLMLNRTAC